MNYKNKVMVQHKNIPHTYMYICIVDIFSLVLVRLRNSRTSERT